MIKKRLTTLIVALGALATAATAANKIPADKAVRIGTLDNGLTYYIRHNEVPASMADFFIAQRVGSVNEEEHQRGLAHFLEHMCFNGTAHFPGNSLISYLESIGVKFGRNLNAYTSTDETVYNICQVPTARQSSLDSCLLVLRDWSHDLTLNGDDIDAERGVIEGEWRQRNGSPNNRLLEKAAPVIYQGGIYGNRLPIGLMSVVKNFDHQALRDYYHRWYRPENQCLIVVGDIDPDYIEGKIKAMWADVPASAVPAIPPRQAVAGNDSVIAGVFADKEQATTTVQLYLKHAGVADSSLCTIDEVRRDYIAQLASDIIAERFDAIERLPSAALSNTGVGDTKFLLSNCCRAIVARSTAKPGKALEVVADQARVMKGLAAQGVLPTELQRAKLTVRARLDDRFANRAKTSNTAYAKRYVRHYLDGGALPSDDAYHKMMKGVTAGVTAADVDNYLRSIIDTTGGRDAVVVIYAPEGSADAALTAAQVADAYNSVNGNNLPQWTDTDLSGELTDALPAPGRIVKQKRLKRFDAEEWTLSNGIKMIVKHTDYKPNQVLILANSPGGFSQRYDPAQKANYKMANDVLAVSGYGRYDSSQLRRLLVGKTVKTSVEIGNMDESLEANTTPDDLETAFKVLYLKATAVKADSAAYRTLIDNTRLRLQSHAVNPTTAMGDSIHTYIYGRHPFGSKLHAADIDRVDYATILDMHRDRFGDMTDFTFYVVGNFDTDSLKAYASRYVATLPAAGRKETPRDAGYRFPAETSTHRFTMAMETPQAIAYTFYSGPCDYNAENVAKASAFGQILSSKLYADIRESRGWTYSIKTHCSVTTGMNGTDPALFLLPVNIKVAPENADSTIAIVNGTFNAMKRPGGITEAEVEKVKNYMLKNAETNATDNAYWITLLKVYGRTGIDMSDAFTSAVSRLTAKDLSTWADSHLKPTTAMTLIMEPESATDGVAR